MFYITDGKWRLEDTKYIIWGSHNCAGLTVDNCMPGAQSSTRLRQSNRQHFPPLLREPSYRAVWGVSDT